MARPERNTVDYFPFICEEGKKMFYIEETYGNDGFATFVKILRELAKTEYHYLDLSKNTTLMFLSARCKVTKEVLESIIKDLCELGKFDTVLWNENKVIWCQDFIDSIQDAYNRRNNKCITYKGLLILLEGLGIRKQRKLQSKGDINPQSIVEDSKLKESKKKKKEFIPPTLDEVKNYFLVNEYKESAAIKAFKYYEAGEWYDSTGKKVNSWKQKMQSVWFKDENKIQKVKLAI